MSTKQKLYEHLERQRGFVAGGTLERLEIGAKPSNIARRLRDLVNEGKIERRLTQIEGKGVKFVEYKVIQHLSPFHNLTLNTQPLL